jgi:hypothetical protein
MPSSTQSDCIFENTFDNITGGNVPGSATDLDGRPPVDGLMADSKTAVSIYVCLCDKGST